MGTNLKPRAVCPVCKEKVIFVGWLSKADGTAEAEYHHQSDVQLWHLQMTPRPCKVKYTSWFAMMRAAHEVNDG